MNTGLIVGISIIALFIIFVIVRLLRFDARQLSILDKRIATLTTEKESAESERKALQERLHEREVELAEARTSLQRIEELTTRNTELEKQLTATREELQRAQIAHTELTAENHRLVEKAESDKAELERLTTRNAELGKQLTATREELQLAQIAHTELTAENHRLVEKAESDKAELEKLQGSFRAEFKNLAGEMMEENSRRFKQTNKESMDILLKPFKDNIVEFRERVEKIYAAENTERGSLRQELKQLMELNRTITEQTNSLTAALRGNSKVQGDFGEMILQTILERSNLKRDIHYSVQENFKDEEGRNLRPDVVLNLPEGKRIIIDSKVSLTAHVDMIGAEEPERREEALARHVTSVRSHIKELADKGYQDLLEGSSPDFVIMFIPGEAAFLDALNASPSLWEEAYMRKIILSSPTNLFALLKIVDDLWRRDQQNRNAQRIAEAGGRLYDKVAGFVSTLEGVQKSITTAAEGCDKAIKQLHTGRGNILRQTENLRELGAKTAKQLPSHYTEEPEEEFRLIPSAQIEEPESVTAFEQALPSDQLTETNNNQ